MASKNKLPVAKKPIPVTVVSNSTTSNAFPMPKEDKDWAERERKYKAEDALRTIQTAEGYKNNKQLMSDVKKLAKDQMNCLKKI